MTSIERHYRLITLMERLQQIEAELCVLGDTSYGDERYRIDRATWHAMKAGALLMGHAPATKRELTAALKRSIKVCEKAEGPDGASPFLKQTTD